jgi:hypothetical protein
MRGRTAAVWLIPVVAVSVASGEPDTAPAGVAAPGSGLGLLEELLKQELTRRLGPARSYEVHIDPQGTDLARGAVGGIAISAVDVRTPDGLLISRLEARAEPMRLGADMKPLDGAPAGRFTASFNEHALTRLARRNGGKRLRDVRVEIHRGKLVVRARPGVLGLKVDTEVAGRPVLRQRNEVHFRASRVAILGVRITEFAADLLEKQVNPLVDLSELKLPVRFRDLRVRREYLTLEGTLDLSRL